MPYLWKCQICQMELMEMKLIPSDCRFSVRGTNIQLLVMVVIYSLLPLNPLPPLRNSDWQGWIWQLLHGSQRSLFRRQAVPFHPLIRFRIAWDISVAQIAFVAVCEPQEYVCKWGWEEVFLESRSRWLRGGDETAGRANRPSLIRHGGKVAEMPQKHLDQHK